MEGGLEDEARGVEAEETEVAAGGAFVGGAKGEWRGRGAERVSGGEEVGAEGGEGGRAGGQGEGAVAVEREVNFHG